ncbi:MAG: sugar phosphate isomerase/epimerase [Planctomycetes bacterium]|nr:sugar phosphate isomerase/epimerase [Planctomycetota bacterium]
MQTLQIGVCTWSLAIPDLTQTLAAIKDKLRLGVIHLGFFGESHPEPNKIIDTVKASGLTVSAGCVGFAGEDYSTIQTIARTGGYLPDDVFDDRFAKTLAAADITARLGSDMLSVHVGFVPEDHGDPKHKVMVDRVRRLADGVGERGVKLVMETGQESPEELMAFMDEVGRPNLGVNFDPANMILYGIGEPIDAVALLKERIIHVHMKDAVWAAKPRLEWGEEVVLGTGEADIPRVVSKLRAQGYTGTLAIEREAGNQRLADIQEAITLLKSLLG